MLATSEAFAAAPLAADDNEGFAAEAADASSAANIPADAHRASAAAPAAQANSPAPGAQANYNTFYHNHYSIQ